MTVIAMSRTEIDRMSVLQDLAASRIKVAEAAALMSLGRRQVFRLAKAYSQQGPEALVSRRRGRPSNRCYPSALRTAAIGIIRERYPDFGPTPAAEKLAEHHDIHLARETVRQWMITAGLWKDRRARLEAVHQPRYRRDWAARQHGSMAARGGSTPPSTISAVPSKQTSGGTIDEALACQERKCFVSSVEGVSYPCIFFSRI
jgi:hypothetical protein